MRVLRGAGALVLLLATGCGADAPTAPTPSAAPTATAAPTTAASGQPALPTVSAQVGDVVLQVELASTPEERAAGLRGREVPAGTGMAFLYPGGAPVRFTMAGVDEPLVAVFARDGRAVSVEQLAPCAGTVAECPTYGPGEPVDVVVEAAPGSLPAARPGDPVRVG